MIINLDGLALACNSSEIAKLILETSGFLNFLFLFLSSRFSIFYNSSIFNFPQSFDFQYEKRIFMFQPRKLRQRGGSGKDLKQNDKILKPESQESIFFEKTNILLFYVSPRSCKTGIIVMIHYNQLIFYVMISFMFLRYDLFFCFIQIVRDCYDTL